MNTEELSMMTWAFEHPYLYTIIEIKPPLLAIGVYVIIKISFLLLKGMSSKNSKKF